MTKEDVIAKVAEIKSFPHDPESAHSYEDDLWYQVLQHIAEGATNAQELAAEAIKSYDIDFPRWCA